MPAHQVSVNNRVLTAEVRGSGAPPVVFIGGTGEHSSDSFAAVIAALEQVTTTIGYARPGADGSPTVPTTAAGRVPARGLRDTAAELRELLASLAVEGPWIIVGHSYGALIAEVFARIWPAEVRGVVLVDASDPQLWVDTDQVLVPDGTDGIPIDTAAAIADLQQAGEHDAPLECPVTVVTCRPRRWLDLDADEAARWEPFTLSEIDDRWQQHQRNLAERLDADQVVAEIGGHHVQKDQPDLVVSSIRWLLAGPEPEE